VRIDGRRRTPRHAPRVALLVCCTLAATCALCAAAELETAHFAIQYSTRFGSRAAATAYAEHVGESLEAAYDRLVREAGFAIFPGRIEVHITDSGGGEMGAEYLDQDEEGNPFPVIEIATEAAMEDSVAQGFTEATADDLVATTAAHELFHVIQDYAALQGVGDMSETPFIEAHATAIQELVVPDVDDYLEPALDFLLAPDSIAFFHRTYDAGIFWVYAADVLAGFETLERIMAASATYEGRHAIDAALREYGMDFDELWSGFAVAYATESLRDQASIQSLVSAFEEETSWPAPQSEPAPVVPLVYSGTWSGPSMEITRVTEDATLGEAYGAFPVDPVGTPLRVAHAYGIDVIEILPTVGRSMRITFVGDRGTQFRVVAASRQAASWETHAVAPELGTLVSTVGVDRVRIVITRGEAGTGTYSLQIAASD